MKKNKNLEEVFRDKFQNYEQEPPAYLLENILAGAASARRRRKIVFWRIAGVAAALLLAFVAGWQFNQGDGQQGINTQVVITGQAVPAKKIPSASKEAVQLAVVRGSDTNGKENFRLSKESSDEKNALPTETVQAASNNKESALLKPLKSISRLINQDTKSFNTLQERKSKDPSADWAEKTIDQQIMEQNRQITLAQNEARGKGRWLVGAQVSPEYNVSRSSHSQAYASNMLNSSSASPVDLGGGLSVEYKVGKRWSVQSGVYYSGMGQESGNSSYSAGKDYLFAGADRGSEYFNTNVSIDTKSSKMMMNSTAGVIEFSGVPSGIEVGANLEDKSLASAVVVSDARFIQNFEYLEIPLYLRYTLLDSRFDVEMIGGFSSNVLVGNNTYMESSSGKSLEGSTKDMESLNYSGTLGIGLKYGLSKHIYLNVEPRIKYYLNSLNGNSSVTYKPYTIGVFTGLSYEF